VATKVYKAELKALQRELRVLNNLLYTFAVGEKYADEIGSQMFRQVKRARNLKQAEVWAVRGLIEDNESELADYIKEKEYFYQEMRKIRKGQN
jgi:ribosomal protein S13